MDDELRKLVHKRRHDQVILESVRDRRPGELVIGVRNPGATSRFRGGGPKVDPLYVAETLRQATILAAHELFGVSLGWAFLMDRIVVAVNDVALEPVGDRIVLTLSARDVVARGGSLSSLVAEVVIRSGEKVVGRGVGHLRVLDPRIYQRLRGDRESSADLPPRAVRGGVALERHQPDRHAGRRWRVCVDPRDPFFFDHPVDHLPGMVLLKAAVDAVREVSGTASGAVSRFDGVFMRFVGVTEEVVISVRPIRDSAEGVEFEVGAVGGGGGPEVFRARVVARTGSVADPWAR